ncbi:MAG: RRXRR domain-containing protein [Verrucomicrobia bacterium]|nr:RRXRR domain-containing protein [Verrucomicrobiota bacterium]
MKMTQKQADNNVSQREAVITKWQESPFYTKDVVLGIDIGIKGIGLAVRRGREILYCKTLMVDLPEQKPLKKRRILRSARRARKSRRVRMNRLKRLFQKHGLPWVDDEVMRRSDPFLLRDRAVNKNGLASKEALYICIRHLVAHRGYDFYAFTDGEAPWGECSDFKAAKKWLSSTFVSEEIQNELLQDAEQFFPEKDLEVWESLVKERLEWSRENSMEKNLREYASNKANWRRGRGISYPRPQIKEHLEQIIERHKHLIKSHKKFTDVLFSECDDDNKDICIFHYNRKTKAECKKVYERKVRTCPFAKYWNGETQKCASRSDHAVRKWNLLDFLSNRRFRFMEGSVQIMRTMPEDCVKLLIDSLKKSFEQKLTWKDHKEKLVEALKQHGLKIANPPKELSNKAKKSDAWKQLQDLLAPGKPLTSRAKLSSESAQELFDTMTQKGTSFDPKKISERKKELKYYDILGRTLLDYGVYPQAQKLMGTLRKPKSGEKPSFGTKGFLQRLFEVELKDQLKGKKVPDRCIIECIKDPPRNKKEQDARASANMENREFVENLLKEFGYEGEHSRSLINRLKLYRQQGGEAKNGQVTKEAVCPFTGELLGKNPLSSDLDLAHLFPDGRGGLAIEDNLVLTKRSVNQDMGQRTPREVAGKQIGKTRFLSWNEMLAQTKSFKWNDKKRELFAFEPAKGQSAPDFENLTRTAQLARQLRRMICFWMGIQEDSKETRNRIGNPSGLHTAAARRGWEISKNRSDLTHHRMDAAVLSFIPPGAGLNSVMYGGIFEEIRSTKEINGNKIRVVKMQAAPELKPDLSALEKDSRTECPVINIRSTSKCKPLGDKTFWSVDEKGETWQRTTLIPLDKDELKDFTPEKIREKLLDEGKTASDIPSDKELEKWLRNPKYSLHLKDGQPIRFVHKKGSKGDFKNPVGWSGILHPNGKIDQLRKLDLVNDRLELWVGFDPKKGWQYYKRIIPSKDSMLGWKRLGIPWRGQKGLPEYTVQLLGKKCKDLKVYYCGTLPKYSHKVGEFKKGDCFLLDVSEKNHKKQNEEGTAMFSSDINISSVNEWFEVSAITTDKRIELKPIITDGKKFLEGNMSNLAQLLKLPISPEECAQQNGWKAPR